MSIYYYFLGECVEDDVGELIRENGVKIYNDYLFCTEDIRESLENKYRLKFYPCDMGLYDLVCDEFNMDCLLDHDLVFRTNVQSDNNLHLYNICFEDWINYWKDIFLEDLSYMVENYDECEKNYFHDLGIRMCQGLKKIG